MNQKFPYILRISEKAKHVRFQVSAEQGLVIVVPRKFKASRLTSLVEQNSRWIERALQKAKVSQGLLPRLSEWRMPEEIALVALDQKWKVITTRNDTKPPGVEEITAATLIVQGALDDAVACQTALKDWITRKAKVQLIPWLARLSKENALPYSSVSIRQQRSRWGSCSARSGISLNARLLFLPPDLVTYVMVHELCHTVHLNHSANFWRLVESRLPDYRRLDRHLRDSGQRMPGWLTASAGGS